MFHLKTIFDQYWLQFVLVYAILKKNIDTYIDQFGVLL